MALYVSRVENLHDLTKRRVKAYLRDYTKQSLEMGLWKDFDEQKKRGKRIREKDTTTTTKNNKSRAFCFVQPVLLLHLKP